MARIIAIDYGKKRTGIAVTDPLKITDNPYGTIPTSDLLDFLSDYIKKEAVEGIVVGMPRRLNNEDSHSTQDVIRLVSNLKNKFTDIQIFEEDERFTSKMAMAAMIEGGMKKKNRQKKENVDKISATLILQSFLNRQSQDFNRQDKN